jgi:hypothetical protein
MRRNSFASFVEALREPHPWQASRLSFSGRCMKRHQGPPALHAGWPLLGIYRPSLLGYTSQYITDRQPWHHLLFEKEATQRRSRMQSFPPSQGRPKIKASRTLVAPLDLTQHHGHMPAWTVVLPSTRRTSPSTEFLCHISIGNCAAVLFPAF